MSSIAEGVLRGERRWEDGHIWGWIEVDRFSLPETPPKESRSTHLLGLFGVAYVIRRGRVLTWCY